MGKRKKKKSNQNLTSKTCSLSFTADYFSQTIKPMRAKMRNWTCSNYWRTSRPPANTPRAQEVTRESRQWLITIGPLPPSHRASASVAPDGKIINAVAVIRGPCSHGNEKTPPTPHSQSLLPTASPVVKQQLANEESTRVFVCECTDQ